MNAYPDSTGTWVIYGLIVIIALILFRNREQVGGQGQDQYTYPQLITKTQARADQIWA